MRIIHVAPGYWPLHGGAELHTQKVSEGLARRGHQVTVMAVRSPASTTSGVPLRSGTIDSVQILWLTGNPALSRIVERLWKTRGTHRLLRSVVGSRVVKVISTGPLNGRLFLELLWRTADVVGIFEWSRASLPYEAALAKKLRRWRLVGIPLFHTEESWSRDAVYPPLLSCCDAVITNTTHEKHFVEARMARPARVVVGGVGVDPGAFSDLRGEQIRVRYGLGNAPVVGYVGRIATAKGVPGLIRAMRAVWQWNQDARLVLAGSVQGPSLEREVELALAELSARERAQVLLLRAFATSDKADIFDSFDVFAMPSIAESFGIAYLEAWMCRNPVIGAEVGSTRCVVRDGIDGLLVDPHDPAKIGRAILHLLKNRAEAARLGEAGYARTVSEFTWERVIDRVEALYMDLTASSVSRASRRGPDSSN